MLGIPFAVLAATTSSPLSATGPSWQPFKPGVAVANGGAHSFELSNRAVAYRFFMGEPDRVAVLDHWNHASHAANGELFRIRLSNGRILSPANMKQVGGFTVIRALLDPKSASEADHIPGKAVTSLFLDPVSGLRVSVVDELRNGSHYVRNIITLTATKGDVNVLDAIPITMNWKTAAVVGTVTGSPIVASDVSALDRNPVENGDVFLGAEHPMAVSQAGGWIVAAGIQRKLPIKSGESISYSGVVGIAPVGQMRRAFLAYVERERAHPYRPFLHYNTWYDLGEFGRFTSAQVVERIHEFGDELVKKRGVVMSGILMDDGWDDPHTVWKFNKGFPNGLAEIVAAGKPYGIKPGLWLSPWGGYGQPRDERLATGKKLGYEIDREGYALSGPKYYARFHHVTMDFVKKYGVNQFKFDGTGSPDKQYPGSAFASDFEAAIALIKDLRSAEPGLFINLTTGTWPSPFWLRFADSTWRGGEDHSFAGVGSNREKWITYRDGDTFHGVVEQGPLYPINSLMLHGIIYAKYTGRLHDDPGNDFRNEVRSYFATGTQLQEMYITPSLLTKQNWNDLAEAAKWSRANKDVLVDNHWIGGDPMKLEVYGWAAWNRRKAIITLRNPSDKTQAYSVDIAKCLQLPKGWHGTYTMMSPYASDKGMAPIRFTIGQSKVVMLKPFQVLVLEGASR